ncbi:hypothetical protein QE152_g22376 [Popillia japonica]|uniref:Uncharacterized protein n=1 Tax=Popillia japonica TaxID=7064 RepID=A0AAW1KMA9_POPJA
METIVKCWKPFTLKDAILNLLNAWEKVSMETIVKCWKPVLEFDEPDEDDIPLSILRERYHPRDINSVVQQTLGMLNMIAPNVNYTATEVLDWNDPSHSEACKAFDTCLIWAERNIHNINDILVLKRLQEVAILRSTQHKTKQTKLTSFFDTV